MVILLVFVLIALLVAVPLVIDNRDLLLDRLHGLNGVHGVHALTALTSRDRAPEGEPPLPFLIIPTSNGNGAAPIPPARVQSDLPWQPRGDAPSRWADPAQVTSYAPAAIATPDEVSEEEIVGAQTVVFRHPSDEPMQILPGHLEIVAGEPARDDLRFFGRLGEPVRITLGREAGSPQRTITLHSPTVSRRHARMEFVDGRWQITNLSRTNPVLVNERMLAADGSVPCVLAEGDRIELGEVVLRFHER